jgi:hypothetical protein
MADYNPMSMVQSLFPQQDPNQFNIQQATGTANRSMDISQQRGNSQADLEMQRRLAQNQALQNQNLDFSRQFAVQTANPAANAKTARDIAQNTAATLNNMYAQSAGNLMNAASNTQNALNSAAANVTGLFR